MIHFYVGKPRNGKSLRVMMKIIEVLTKTEQHVVTNMVLRLDELQEYLDARGHSIHVIERVTLIDDEQTRNFWLYRGGDYVLPTPEGYGDKKDKDPENVSYVPLFEDPRWRVGGKLLKADGSPADFRGTCYVIDEVQNLWPARGWQGTGHHISFYLSQHGKLGDTVYFITQNVKNVDRLLYSVAQDFTYCRNHRMEKHGRFRGDDKFSAKTYPGPVQDGNEATLNVEEFKLDLDVARCYDTSAGVGMPGGGTADAGFRAKGVPLKLVWVALALILVFCFWLFRWGLPSITNRFIAPAIDPAGQSKAAAASKVFFDPPTSPSRSSVDRQASVSGSSDAVPELSSVWIETVDGGPVVHAALADGAVLPPRWITAYNLDGYPRPWVEAQGVRYFLRKKRPTAAPEESEKTMLTDAQQAHIRDSHSTKDEIQKTNSPGPAARTNGLLAVSSGPNVDAR